MNVFALRARLWYPYLCVIRERGFCPMILASASIVGQLGQLPGSQSQLTGALWVLHDVYDVDCPVRLVAEEKAVGTGSIVLSVRFV
jgi:hypothetical protein